MHQTTGERDPSTAHRLPQGRNDTEDRRAANRAIAVSALGLALTGLIELAFAALSGSVALLGDALHNLSDVSTSLAVFVGFRVSRRVATESYPYGYERAEDLAGVLIAFVIWLSALLAGAESVLKLVHRGTTTHVGWAIGAALVGIVGNQLVARYKLHVGRRIHSATLIADARHSWLDALSSAGAAIGLLGVLAGLQWADGVAGLVVTGFICHVGWEVTSEVAHRLMDGADPETIITAETAAAEVPGVRHAHARARTTGRVLRVEVEGWVDAATTAQESDCIGQQVADRLAALIPNMASFTWIARSV
jgi:cation diffusion facilitator family transporter